ncbi:hypothetical protein [Nocardia macrotermitis]|uniref:Uncharacterized protein n=1 Tax=Nocardia macrotermitis TaxID=2585198 RepID=A0A7K0CVR9_9NOCA|nr:hypothetical protein [Nocardia macrotermitis]MQY17483.1 hypothetical protein [Nocardia macrotermitis]
MIWGVLVVAIATAILFSSFFTETWAREAAQRADDPAAPAHTHRALWDRQRRLQAITRWLRMCAVLYLLIGLLADWLCLTVVR